MSPIQLSDFPDFEGPMPWLRRVEMVEVDRLMVDEYGITLERMMEHAGRHLATLACARFLGRPEGRRVRVLVGAGGNGGGGLVAARRLTGWGAQVEVVLASDEIRFKPVTKAQLAICRRLNIPVTTDVPSSPDAGDDLILDAMVGYGLVGPVRGGRGETLIRWSNSSVSPIVALDIPSGIDADRGPVDGVAVRATATLTLGAPKLALKNPATSQFSGDLYVGDIGIPPQLFDEPSLERLYGRGPRFRGVDLMALRLGSQTRH